MEYLCHLHNPFTHTMQSAKEEIEALRRELNEHNYNYYVLNSPAISDYDYDMMMAADADVLEELSHLSDNIKFIVMDKEEDGSCIIEMPEEIVDISVNTQIENIRDILENIRI